MADRHSAQAAVFDAVQSELGKLDKANITPTSRAVVVRDLALAYRYALGGQQPGGIHVEK